VPPPLALAAPVAPDPPEPPLDLPPVPEPPVPLDLSSSVEPPHANTTIAAQSGAPSPNAFRAIRQAPFGKGV
jgi:hypothetical protein